MDDSELCIYIHITIYSSLYMIVLTIFILKRILIVILNLDGCMHILQYILFAIWFKTIVPFQSNDCCDKSRIKATTGTGHDVIGCVYVLYTYYLSDSYLLFMKIMHRIAPCWAIFTWRAPARKMLKLHEDPWSFLFFRILKWRSHKKMGQQRN